jgi:hypothetical protein
MRSFRGEGVEWEERESEKRICIITFVLSTHLVVAQAKYDERA